MITSVMLRSSAKVNIGLHLVGKRPDGYHLLETLYYPLPALSDMLLIMRDEGEGCQVIMEEFEGSIPLEENLVYKAWRLMTDELEKTKAGVVVRVKKTIPAGAGLGGGSSNAAAMMKGLRDLWKMEITDAQLASLAVRLGADVPFFIHDRIMYGTGTGTVLDPFDLDLGRYEMRLKLFNIHSSTVESYRDVREEDIGHGTPLKELLRMPVSEWRHHVVNDLEKPVFARYPVLAQAKEELYLAGAVFASMSGSGSAMYGLFER
jgi:4-diphosphocytidyl-2-C-methyl-D-erythritol kinase